MGLAWSLGFPKSESMSPACLQIWFSGPTRVQPQLYFLAWVLGRRKSKLRARARKGRRTASRNKDWNKKFSRFQWWCQFHRHPRVRESRFPSHPIPVLLLSLWWGQMDPSIPGTSSLGWWLKETKSESIRVVQYMEWNAIGDPPHLWLPLRGKIWPVWKRTILGNLQKVRELHTVSLSTYWAPTLCRCWALGLCTEQGKHDRHPQRA